MRRRVALPILAAFAVLGPGLFGGAVFGFSALVPTEEPVFVISIKDHVFEPAELDLPAGERVKLVFKNLDPTPEEFESDDIGFEKIVLGGMQTSIYVGPLEPGTYSFFGEFHLDTAQGRLIVK